MSRSPLEPAALRLCDEVLRVADAMPRCWASEKLREVVSDARTPPAPDLSALERRVCETALVEWQTMACFGVTRDDTKEGPERDAFDACEALFSKRTAYKEDPVALLLELRTHLTRCDFSESDVELRTLDRAIAALEGSRG